MSDMTNKEVWIKKLMKELGVDPNIINLVEIYCDNNGVIAQAKQP